MERTKLYKLIIAALVIINVGMLVFFLTRKPPHNPPKTSGLAKEIGIEGKKKTLVTKLEKEHHKEKQKLMKTDRSLHDVLFSKIGTDEDVSLLQDKIEANHAQIEKMTYDFFNEVSKLCTPEQNERLKKNIHRAFKQMKGPKKKK